MSNMSNFLENELLDHILGTGSYSAPCTYIALDSASPTDSGFGTEISGTGYTRILVGNWDAAVSGASENTCAISFPQAGGDWGTVKAIVITDGSTPACATNVLFFGELSTSKIVGENDTFEISASALDISFD